MKPLLVLRPEPGNSMTAARARRLGLAAVSSPLFAVEPVAWSVPDAGQFDMLLLTSANAVRMAGPRLAVLSALATAAVGPATAAAARNAGLRVERTGESGVEALLAALPGTMRLVHLAGADHVRPASAHLVDTRIVYRAVPLPARLPDARVVALVHSARAGARLASLAHDKGAITIAAISGAAATACGDGWAALEVAPRPDDAALLALAARLCQE